MEFYCIDEKRRSGKMRRKSRDLLWKESTNPGEVRIVLDIVILQGIVQKPNIDYYHSTNPLIHIPIFGKIISRDRLKLIFKYLHFSSYGQMALESTTCGIVHHARRTRAHCPTMVSSFKLSSGTVCLLGFSCRAGHIRKGKYKICGSYQVQDCTGRNGIVHHARRMTRCCNISS